MVILIVFIEVLCIFSLGSDWKWAEILCKIILACQIGFILIASPILTILGLFAEDFEKESAWYIFPVITICEIIGTVYYFRKKS